MKNDMLKNILIWTVVATVMLSIFNHFSGQKLMGSSSQLAYSDFIDRVRDGSVSQVSIEGGTIHGVFTDGKAFTTYNPGDAGLMGDLLNNNVKVTARRRKAKFVDANFHFLVPDVVVDRHLDFLHALHEWWLGR